MNKEEFDDLTDEEKERLFDKYCDNFAGTVKRWDPKQKKYVPVTELNE